MKRLDRVHQQSTSQDINTRLLLVTADVLLLSPLSINPSLGSIAGGAEIAYQRLCTATKFTCQTGLL